tara:strand:+ start:1073 stop:1303 length:231 start_codon:yes stop_codon:yes gene_type:complete
MQDLQITDGDLQALFAQNPLAAEQLRRIMAERHRDELAAELAELRNGPGDADGLNTTSTTSTNNKNDSKLTAVGAD